jgi:hypothetical protein
MAWVKPTVAVVEPNRAKAPCCPQPTGAPLNEPPFWHLDQIGIPAADLRLAAQRAAKSRKTPTWGHPEHA